MTGLGTGRQTAVLALVHRDRTAPACNGQQYYCPRGASGSPSAAVFVGCATCDGAGTTMVKRAIPNPDVSIQRGPRGMGIFAGPLGPWSGGNVYLRGDFHFRSEYSLISGGFWAHVRARARAFPPRGRARPGSRRRAHDGTLPIGRGLGRMTRHPSKGEAYDQTHALGVGGHLRSWHRDTGGRRIDRAFGDGLQRRRPQPAHDLTPSSEPRDGKSPAKVSLSRAFHHRRMTGG
jgi:hypothetical protein